MKIFLTFLTEVGVPVPLLGEAGVPFPRVPAAAPALRAKELLQTHCVKSAIAVDMHFLI